ncbi:MAG: NEAT domain-containing protein, partial [Andreesenia angusta]|nr:NEAT domain-containing protein [Andreesenia angusta]
MNMKRKILSVSLSVAMLAGTMPISYVNAEIPVSRATHEVSNFDDVKITGTEYIDSYGTKELYINFSDEKLNETEFLAEVKELYINGNLFEKTDYNWKYDGSFRVIDTDEKLQKAVGEKVETVKFVMNNGKSIEYPESSDGTTPGTEDPSTPGDNENDTPGTSDDNEEVGVLELGDNLEDGVYTIGFRGLNFNDKNQGSMMEETFDKNVKLTVKDGKKYIEMLNHTFGEYLITLGIKGDSGWITADKSDYAGEYSGNIPRNIFKFEIDDLTKTYEAGVLVSMMGGKETDIGKYDKYQKFWLQFKGPIEKEFTKYKEPKETYEEMQKDQERLVDALIEQGADANSDGDITSEELMNFSPEYGELDLSGLELNDISMLSDLGDKVLSINLIGNKLKELPENLFANAKNLERVYLSNNKLSTLNPNQFVNNLKLEAVVLNNNNILAIDKNTFKKNEALKEIELGGNGLRELPEGIFANNNKLASVYMPNNELERLPDNLFEGTNIKLVSLESNSLKEIPKSIGQESLEKVYLSANQIKNVPEELSNANNLKVLDLSGNLVEELPDKVWTNIASKDDGDLLLRDNRLKKIPSDLLKGKSFRNIELALNYLPESMPNEYEALGVDPKQSDKYYPQKGQFDLDIGEEESSINFKNKEILEKLLIWTHIDRDIPTDINGVDKYIESKGMDAIELAKEYFVYKINYRVEKKIGDKFEVIEDIVLPDSTEDAPITIDDKNKKKGDVYRVVKTISASSGAGDFYRKGTFEKQFVTEKGKEDSDDNVSNEKIYSVPVKLLKSHENTNSMGNGALIQTAKVIERESDNKAIIFLELEGLDFMNMRGHLLNMWTYPDAVNFDKTKLDRAHIIDWKEDQGLKGTGRFPSKVKIIRNKLREDIIGVRVEVDAMKEIDGKGQQDARLSFDWSKAVDITPDAPDTPDTPDT